MSTTKERLAKTPRVEMRRPHRLYRPDARAVNLLSDKWTPLILAELAHGPVRFVDIQRLLLGTISTESLRTALNRMVESNLVTRTRYNEVPPRVDYELTDKGRAALKVVEALYQFGMDYEWGNTRRGERKSDEALARLVAAFGG